MIEFRNTGYFIKSNGEVIGKKKTLKKTITPYGYESVCLYHKGKRKTFLVHRLVAECYITKVENKPDINHKDGDKLNNDFSNLEWVTKNENIKHFHKFLNKRKIGEHPNSKLTYNQMKEIADQHLVVGIYQRDLAERYNVNRCTISKAIKTIQKQKQIR